MRFSLAVLTLAAGVVVPTGVAHASTVSVDPGTGAAVFQSGPAASDVTSQLVAFTSVQFKDAAQTLTAGTGCVAGPPVGCAATEQDIRFGNGNDRFRAVSIQPITITAGGGADSIRTAGSFNTVSAGTGNDSVWENGNSKGSVKGDGGNDKLYSYEASANIQGGAGDDLLTTTSPRFDNSLSGGTGDDDLVVTGVGSGTLSGGDDDDVIVIDAQFGGYTADGGAGNDVISGSPGADTVTGGPGTDYIDVSGDGPGDTVDCGSGFDVAIYDAGDVVAKNCELKTHGPVGAIAPVTSARNDAAAFIAAMPAIPAF
jgi:Ca2+-binding RTX toxin-like protein